MAIPGNLFNSIWENLTKDFSSTLSDTTRKWHDLVIKMYSESQRHYHTLAHVEEMLNYRILHVGKLTEFKAVDYAIIFHDLVYNPKAADNEERSANKFGDFAKECSLSDSLCDRVFEMIIATKKHTTPEHLCEEGGQQDLHFLLDFDMAVLGRQREGYQYYADQIRQEYIHIPEEIYCTRRAHVLKSFLEVPYIFATSEFRNTFESQARKNIQEEIDHLSERTISL